IHPPAVVGRSEPRSQSALNFWGVTLDPPPDGDVVDQKSALGKEFLHIAVGKGEAQVPADRKQDDLRFKLAPLEQSGNRWDTEHPGILAASLSGQASKVATLPPRWRALRSRRPFHRPGTRASQPVTHQKN